MAWNERKSGTPTKLVIVFLTALMITCLISCNKENPKPEYESRGNAAPVEARSADEPANETPPGNIPPSSAENSQSGVEVTPEEAVKLWPADIPLMEPYTVKTYMSGPSLSFMTIVVKSSLDDVLHFYIEKLEANGWVPEGEPFKVEGKLYSFKAAKEKRSIGVMLNYDDGTKETSINFKYYTGEDKSSTG